MKFASTMFINLFLVSVFILIVWHLILSNALFLEIEILEKSINIILSFIQAVAIILGGWLAHKKFIVERKIDEAIKVKAALMRYRQKHIQEAANYRKRKDIIEYKVAMISDYTTLFNSLHLSVLPRRLRDNIFEVMFIPIAVNKEKVDSEWEKFGVKIEKILNKLDDIIVY